MSRKWQRVKRWDDERLTGPFLPVKWILRAFSSIRMAVTLLLFVSLYAVLASIPIGLLALGMTYTIYALTLVAVVLAIALPPTLLVRRVMRAAGPGARFATTVFLLLALSTAGVWFWSSLAWPRLRYDDATGEGLRLFAGFVDRYSAVTLRRLPGFEMTELQFYSWWPMRLALVLFVANMITATVRRIEFNFKNLGVLTVHTGIITMAMGSLLYSSAKVEGDALLLATPPQQASMSSPHGMAPASQTQLPPGPPQGAFFDREDVVLYVAQILPGVHPAWEQRPLRGLPRYNDYNLNAGAGERSIWSILGVDADWREDPGLPLDQPVPPGTSGKVEADIALRVVGYASYATADEDIVQEPLGPTTPTPPGFVPNPIRFVDLLSRVDPLTGGPAQNQDDPVFRFALEPVRPAGRFRENDAIAVEYTLGMDDARWADLTEPIPSGLTHALVVEIPEKNYREVVRVIPGVSRVLGDTGYRITVSDILPEPPFPIITPGYEDATSSVAIVRVQSPTETYDRWAYHRFPEIDQDLMQEVDPASGMPSRRDADPSIRISLLDASKLQIYFDERPDGSVRTLIRQPRGRVLVRDNLSAGDTIPDIVDRIDLRLGETWDHARPVIRPIPVPLDERRTDRIGTHAEALIAVEVSIPFGQSEGSTWSRVVWLPFIQYMGLSREQDTPLTLPDGRRIRLAFGRLQHRFPGFALRLVDFEMIAYDHRGAPRDYQSIVRVEPSPVPGFDPSFAAYQHVTKLNAPLRAPFHWDPEASWLSNSANRLLSGLNPNQFKLSQAGWDQNGWNQSQQLVDQGQLAEPHASFTILGVGNNPGIHIIALGGILMSVGIPWAFYIKPWLLRREKNRLAAAAQSTRPTSANTNAGATS